MSAVALGIAAALVALRCQLISDDPYVLGSVSRVLPATRPAFIQTLNATRRLAGCPPEGDIEPPTPPFPGGQCAGQLYNVTASGLNALGTTITNTRGPLVGPIGGLVFDPPNEFGGVFVRAQTGDGPSNTSFATTSPGNASTWQIISISPVTASQGDECGDPPPIYPPPTEVNIDVDVTIEGDDGDLVVTIPFIFSPITVNFDGTLRIPFTFDFGGFSFTGSFPLDFNIPITINPPSLPPGSGEDFDSVGDDEPGGTVPPLPPGEKIIGVVVNSEISQPGRVGSVNFENGPAIIVPRAASVKFAYSLGAATFWSSDIDVKTLRAFVPCPFSQGADAAVVTPYIGLESTSVPVRGFALATTNDVRQSP